jgi:alcohol dehydrogenase, propanol-preferring
VSAVRISTSSTVNSRTQSCPFILGHEVVGRVVRCGANATIFNVCDRVGVPWLAQTCGACRFCKVGQENLCDQSLFTGYTADGGYAEYVCANEDFCFSLPDDYSEVEVAPQLCSGLIGYRSLRMAENADRIGIYGFGAAAHIITQIAKFQRRQIFALNLCLHTPGGR